MARTCATLKPPPHTDAVLAPPTPGSNRGARSGRMNRGTDKKPRRKMGHDRVVIAEEFNAPLSPEEAELFGL